jgi:hypothetical protein
LYFVSPKINVSLLGNKYLVPEVQNLPVTASGYEQKALVAPFEVTSPCFALRSVFHAKEGAQKLSGGTSHHGAIFAPAQTDRRERQGNPAKEKVVPVAGFAQSRSSEFGR